MVAVSSAVAAQDRFPRHNFTAGLGAGIPGRDLKGSFEPSFALGFGYGYRFLKNFQADIGADWTFQAARVDDFVDTGAFGYRRIRDYQFFLPFGGRAIVPFANGRAQFFAGGGGAYVRYFEAISQPSNYFRIDCPYCGARSGVGYYGLAGFRWRPSPYRGLWFGASVRVLRVTTDGDNLGALEIRPSRDRWITPLLEVGFSF